MAQKRILVQEIENKVKLKREESRAATGYEWWHPKKWFSKTVTVIGWVSVAVMTLINIIASLGIYTFSETALTRKDEWVSLSLNIIIYTFEALLAFAFLKLARKNRFKTKASIVGIISAGIISLVSAVMLISFFKIVVSGNMSAYATPIESDGNDQLLAYILEYALPIGLFAATSVLSVIMSLLERKSYFDDYDRLVARLYDDYKRENENCGQEEWGNHLQSLSFETRKPLKRSQKTKKRKENKTL